MVPKRWTIAVLSSVGFALALGARCTFGGVRAMTHENGTQLPLMVYTLSASSFGLIQGSFYLGYVLMHAPAALVVLTSSLRPDRVFGACIGASCAMCAASMGALLTSQLALVLAVSLVQGALQGFIYPAMHHVWRYWAPPLERSKLTTTAYVGAYLGVAIGIPVTETLVFLVHWVTPFLLYSVLGVLWMAVWLWCVRLKPALDPRVDTKERQYIESAIGDKSDHIKITLCSIPWLGIMSSLPVWAIVVTNFARCWTMFLLVQHQLTYMREALHLNVLMMGIVGAVPHLLMVCNVIIGGRLADYLLSRHILSTGNVRKLMNCTGFGTEAIFLLVLAFSRSAVLSGIALVLGVAASGFAISGFMVNHLDIAPRYAAVLMAVSNGLGATAGVICPMVTEQLVAGHGSERGWQCVFLLAGGIHLCAVLFYTLFARGEQQAWAEPAHGDDDTFSSTQISQAE